MASLLKVGLMGFGFAGATFHAPVIAHSGRTTVAAIATGQPEKARAAYPQAAVVADFDALLAHAGVECVVIATPNDTHFDLARRTLEAGKHVVVDKPVTLSAAEARTLARLAADRGLVFAPFHNRRWDGDFLTVRQLVASGELGRITWFESHFDRFRPQIRQRWREDATRGGGLLFDLGPHLIDQA
ncbi:MAG: Gfo/Idh/MocA family oxidoreductase, partial [Burkholderia gladioli]